MKRKLVWVTFLLLLSIISLLIAGCGQKEGNNVNKGAVSEKYPTKPITLIVPFSAGGSSDMIARAMEKVSAKYLGQSLVVVNKPGGSATIGWNELASSKPDGYTIGITNISIVLQPLYGGTKYNYPQDLEPIAQAASIPVVLAVRADSPWKNVKEFIEYAKSHPGEIKYGHAGIGTSTHVAAEMFAKEAGIKIQQVPFQGGSEALTAFLGGHVQALFANPPEIKSYFNDGKIRILGVADEKRYPDFKDVPTFKEQGLNVVLSIWLGVGGPKGLPEDVKTKLAEGFKNIINDPEFKKVVTDQGMIVDYLSPQEFGAKWKSESERFAKLIKETGIGEQIASQKK
ncbi:Bug family tripartite tricarboxylate transporter substrate binding protein [Neomoorella humiferrea]|uniref:Tripartite tricarboxylate transporter family receptor n=1 Tax=Neomoorella humiferrea TaxID=676965 RepID=A0A2T0AT68_9FIRM|nr:tripartite tricarboxylate transporter substrate binding protein [Moorella humiferrea]PRR73589.1 Tripartite tricarboxylate transporter family receptor [Moorella humiferrea]